MWLEKKTIWLAVGLTILTGLLSIWFQNSILWAPGTAVAFILNGGAHESHLNIVTFWTVDAIFNFASYWLFSWILVRASRKVKIRRLNRIDN
jgi:hypothetical protein